MSILPSWYSIATLTSTSWQKFGRAPITWYANWRFTRASGNWPRPARVLRSQWCTGSWLRRAEIEISGGWGVNPELTLRAFFIRLNSACRPRTASVGGLYYPFRREYGAGV